MAPSHADSASSDEEDAPESVSLAQSKQTIKKHDDAVKQIQAAENEKKRVRNKERDRRLKEQAESSKRRRRENGSEVNLEARMERAMQEAEAEMEMGGGSDSDPDQEGGLGEEDFMGIDAGSGESDEEDDSGEDEDEDEEMETDQDPLARSTKPNPNHLPDHLFTSAFSSKSAKAASKRKANDDAPARKTRKRVRSNAPPKDVLIGSRTIRTLAPGRSAGASTLPSAKIKKFLDRSLALKSGNAKTRGWERRPVNLGVMRHDGPAASFVRKR